MMRGRIERACFVLCLVGGWLLRAGRYSRVRIAGDAGARHVRKSRSFYAPLLVWIARPVMALLDTGVRILPQREWEERERHLYSTVYGAPLQIEANGTLVLPYLAGESLADVLENPGFDDRTRTGAIEKAVMALSEFHRRGFTHADAMAENVMIDFETGVARWFDFETIHEPGRSMTWRRADDLRALLATCLLRTPSDRLAETLRMILDVYADDEVSGVLAASFSPLVRPPLVFYLAQAALTFEKYREIGQLLGDRARARH